MAQLVERAHRRRGVGRRRDWSPRRAVLVRPAVGSLVHRAVRVVGAVAVDRIEPRIDPAASMCQLLAQLTSERTRGSCHLRAEENRVGDLRAVHHERNRTELRRSRIDPQQVEQLVLGSINSLAPPGGPRLRGSAAAVAGKGLRSWPRLGERRKSKETGLKDGLAADLFQQQQSASDNRVVKWPELELDSPRSSPSRSDWRC